jgi:SPP1 gp7 family putative phage head morphogenesis protein
LVLIFTEPEIRKATAPRYPPLGVTDRAIRDSLLLAVARIKDLFVASQVVRALEANDVEGAIEIIRFEEGEAFLQSVIPSHLRGVYELAAAKAAKDLTTAGMSIRFDIVNPQSVTWIRNHAAELITQWGQSSQQAIRDLILRAFEDGIPPTSLARLIRDTGVGLTSRQALAVENMRRRLTEAGQLTVEQIQARVERYGRKLLRYRTEMIARTEVIRASREGQQALWRQAVERGLLDPSKALQEWVVAEDERLCPICAELDGTTAPLEMPFPEPGGMGPPQHPDCRCTLVLRLDGRVQKTPPWHIVERDGKYLVVGVENGKVFGTHPTKEQAMAHLRALYANVPEARH